MKQSIISRNWKNPKKVLAAGLAFALTIGMCSIPAAAVEKTTGYMAQVPGRLDMSLLARYDVDTSDSEGGLEIVAYNAANRTAYAVDGINRVLIAVPMGDLGTAASSGVTNGTDADDMPVSSGEDLTDLSSDGFQIDLETAAEAAVAGFIYGDITSVAVSPDYARIAVAIQAEALDATGLVAIFPMDDSEDTLGDPVYYPVGVQPDMIVFADGDTVLTANEGEPRMGYGVNSANEAVVDPKGGISIVHLADGSVDNAGFDAFDANRAALAASGVLMTKGQAPSVDFEPEYIVVAKDGHTAYASLQENNAIAVLDIASATITDVYPLGFKDYGAEGNEIYLDGTAKIHENLLGAYMPDGISLHETNGRTFILTANEGDGREWSSTVFPEDHEDAGDPNSDDASYYSNEAKVTLAKDTENEVKKVVVIDPEVVDGLPEGKDVLFGGRSFSLFEATSNGLTLVYDSGSEFEDITSALYPDWFNTSHDKLKANDRSLKKGPEAENVTVGMVDGRTYAFVALERIGGIMAYDITDPADIRYSNYINTRDFASEDGIGGDSGPEGLAFIPAAAGNDGKALLLTGCEITGTMPVYALSTAPGDLTDKLVILHTNDTHGGDVAVEDSAIGTAGVAQLVKDYEAAGAEVLLISAGDAIQGDPLVNLGEGEVAVEFMNLAGYDLMIPGNHEFDYGYDTLQSLETMADFPILSANILDRTTGEAVFEENLILETTVGKVGLFGLTTPETQTKANPDNVASLAFAEGEALYAIAQAQVDELAAAGCERIICVAHLGVDEGSTPNTSLDVIEHVNGIDLLIDGHSHSVIDGDEDADTILVSAGTRLSHVGVAVLDDDGTEAWLISAKDYNRVDPTIQADVNAVAAEIDAQLATKFAVSAVLLDGARAPGVRTQETNLGDFSADAILWAANEAMGQGTVSAAITNGGGIRASIKVGDITMKDMKTVFPFGNTISTVEVTGAQLLELLEAATFSTPEALGAFPQVAGITFTLNTGIPYENGVQYPNSTYYAPAKPGARITNVTIDGQALNLAGTYTIATNNFLASGGDTYSLLRSLESYNTWVSLEDALVRYTTEVLDGVVTEAKYGSAAGRITMVETAAGSTANSGTAATPGTGAGTGTGSGSSTGAGSSADNGTGAAETAGATGGSGTAAHPAVGSDSSGTTYTVVEGDSLWKLAKRFLGAGDRYMEIHELNKTIIQSPELIFVGQKLLIPVK